jgi:hypothetical protein
VAELRKRQSPCLLTYPSGTRCRKFTYTTFSGRRCANPPCATRSSAWQTPMSPPNLRPGSTTMTEEQKDVVLLSFIQSLKDQGSWCGETHIQKGTYFLQELMGVPFGFEFILYKHGPYSFDLKNELTSHMADALLALKPRPPYGPSLLPAENSQGLLERSPRTRERFQRQAEFIAKRLGSRDVTDLERLATALFVTRQELPDGSVDDRAARLNELKPHIPLELAHDAVVVIDHLITEARPLAYNNE